MKVKNLALGLAAGATLMASVGVAAQSAGAAVEEGGDAGSGSTLVIGLVAAAAVIAGIVVASGGDENELPISN